jgi:histidine triad (HIT) family protein
MQEKTVFEKIIDGDIPCYKVYEDSSTLAFLSLVQKTKGHTLVIPKMHSRNILDISEDSLLKTMTVVRNFSRHLYKVLHATGVRIQQNNEKGAGQEIFHTHFHIIPYFDNVSCENTGNTVLSHDQLIVLSREIYLK